MIPQLLDDIKALGPHFKTINAIILFGSAARGQERAENDIDLCFVLQDKTAENNLQPLLLKLEKKYDKDINVIFTDTTFERLDRHLIETLLREGVLLYGAFPDIPMQRLDLEPYEILKFDLSKIQQSEKMKIKRILYGLTTAKRYNGKVYESTKKGLIDEVGGIRIGIASLLIPEKASWKIEDALKPFHIPVRKITIWLSKP